MTTTNSPRKAYAPDGTYGCGPWLKLIQDRTGPGEPFEGDPTLSGGEEYPLVERYPNGGVCTHELDGTVTVSWPDSQPTCLAEEPWKYLLSHADPLDAALGSAFLAMEKAETLLAKRLEILENRSGRIQMFLQEQDPDAEAEDHPTPRVARTALASYRTEKALWSVSDRLRSVRDALSSIEGLQDDADAARRKLLMARIIRLTKNHTTH